MHPRFSTLSAIALGLAVCGPLAHAQDACDANLSASRDISSVVSDAFAAITAKDRAAQDNILPKLEAAYGKLPAAEIKPQACGNHIDTYTPDQYARLNLLRANGIDIGFASDLPIVKQPHLNQENLGYAIGWIKYERNDFTGALTSLDKALKLFPDSPDLQNEYLATLIQLKRYSDVVAAGERFITNSYFMSDATRSKIFQAIAIAQLNLDETDDAKQSAQVAVYYDDNDSTRATQKLIADAP